MRLLASIFTVILVCCSNYSYSAHIIGGEMYYECLGYANNGLDTTKRSYKITIKLYRDCFASNAAGFDNPVLFTIYKERATGTGYDLVQTPARRQEFEMFLDGPFRVAAPTYPCLILPPNICVEEGRYVTTVDLPIISQEYVIVWQRCCRNNSITNLVTPEATGATFTINIHPESQRSCNSSPQFKSFPPTVVCVNNPLKFDHSAIDKEGDLLIYEFCEPLAGGGRTGGGCDAVVPTPDCPPPFKTAVFKTPFYNYTFPLGGNPKVTIDNITGLITGEPVELGQFVVGVCVSEYRNGVLLSKLRRDFQFNVASCEGTVVAGIQNGNLIGKKQYDILLCGSDQLQMVTNSYQQSYINSLLWTFENGGKIDSSTIWAPLIKFSEGGIHKGQLVLNPGSNCSDTVKYSVNVIPDLNSNFKVKYDTCNAGPVSFTSLASSTYSNIIDHNWALGDGYTAFTPNAEINYFRPGWYNIQYVVRDNFGCKSSSSTAVQWFPAPNVVIFEPTIREGCVPLKVDFKNISFPTDNSYKFVWKFSDSTVLNGFNVNHTFKDTGVYHLKLEVTSPHGCYKDGEFRDIVTVYNPPLAQWNISKKLINLKDPEIILEDISQKTIGRTWILNGNEHYFDQKLKFNYKDTGSYLIKMIVNDKFLCTDTLEDFVFVYRDFSLFMPNAFSPNGDGKNEVFVPFGQIHSLASYSLTVFDRWGAKIFNSSDPEVGWNGRFNNTGKDVPSGVYIYDLNYKVGNKPEFHERKMVTLIR